MVPEHYILNCCACLLFNTSICEQALVDDHSCKLFKVNYHIWVDMFGISSVLSSLTFCQFLVSIISYIKYTQFKIHIFENVCCRLVLFLRRDWSLFGSFWICKSTTANPGLLHVPHQITTHCHAVCHMIGPQPLPKQVFHIVQYSASSFNF
jgi:hypothetical protein